MNLIDNALKYGKRVHVELALSGRSVELIVDDDGPGIPPEARDRVFERFFRADPSGNIPGTGLGMSIVQEIASLHQGEAVVESTLGEGTTATLWLPTVAAWRG